MKNIRQVTWLASMDDRQANFYIRNGNTLQPPFHSLRAVNSNSDNEKTINTNYFAKDVAMFLKETLEQDYYDWLILVAPPGMLGTMRKALDAKVHNALIFELDKNFMQLTTKQIQEYLVSYLAISAEDRYDKVV